MRPFIKQLTFLVLIVFLLAACGGNSAPTQDVNALMTSAVSTMVASFFETQTAMYTPPSPTSTETKTPPPTFTPYDTPTPFPTSTATYRPYVPPTTGTTTALVPVGTGTFVTATINPAALGAGCNNLAFIRDVTIPAGTVLKPMENFVKTWKVQNTGSCPWLYQYRLALLSGDDFGAGDTKIQVKVEVNSWAELSLNLSAPKTEGTYTSYWRLADADNNMFGSTLAVSFVVKK